jgi:hypothetical protein
LDLAHPSQNPFFGGAESAIERFIQKLAKLRQKHLALEAKQHFVEIFLRHPESCLRTSRGEGRRESVAGFEGGEALFQRRNLRFDVSDFCQLFDLRLDARHAALQSLEAIFEAL